MENRERCAGTRTNGRPCRGVAAVGSRFCSWHDPQRRPAPPPPTPDYVEDTLLVEVIGGRLDGVRLALGAEWRGKELWVQPRVYDPLPANA